MNVNGIKAELNTEEAERQGYMAGGSAGRAARRAVRWLNKGTGGKAPGHILEKARLLRAVPSDG